MSFNPFIHDSAFRGSPILSYGRAPSGTVWPKILAILAGILVVLGIFGGIWFWFFSQIPIPDNSAVQIILPANKSLTAKAPLEWKQIQELNKPMPTIAGMVNNADTGEFEAFAIRLSPIGAIFTGDKIWQNISKAHDLKMDYKTPYMIFGWPWELINQEIWLDLDIKQVFSFRNIILDDLPGKVSGQVIDNEWKTDLLIFEDFKTLDSLLIIDNLTNFTAISLIGEPILLNYYSYNGLNIDYSGEYSVLTWKFMNGGADSQLLGAKNSLNLNSSSTIQMASSTIKEFVLPDGDIVGRLYSPNVDTDAEQSQSIITDGLVTADNFVSDMTCSGIVLAKLDSTSLVNFCSWIDICFVNLNQLLFVNRDGYLVVCGY